MAVVIGDESGESPVVDRVLEDVHDGHGGVGEAVHEHRLQQPLGVVEGPGGRGEVRGLTARRGAGVTVDEGGADVEQEIHQQRPGVLGLNQIKYF